MGLFPVLLKLTEVPLSLCEVPLSIFVSAGSAFSGWLKAAEYGDTLGIEQLLLTISVDRRLAEWSNNPFGEAPGGALRRMTTPLTLNPAP